MMKALLIGLIGLFLATGVSAQTRQSVGAYQVQFPAGWALTPKSGNLRATSPADDGDGRISLIFYRDIPATSSQSALHQRIWTQAGGQKIEVKQYAPLESDPSIKTLITFGSLKAGAATVYGMQLSLLAHGRFQAVQALAATKVSLQKSAGRISSILDTMTPVPTGAARTSPMNSHSSRSDLFGAPQGIAGFYFGYRVGLSAAGDLDARGSNIILYKDGTYTSRFPTGGFDGYDLAAHKRAFPGQFFRWIRTGSTLLLDEGASRWRYKIQGQTLIGASNVGGKAYTRIGPATALKLSGVYARQDYKPDQFTNRQVYPGGMWTLTFQPDGSFVDNSEVRPLYSTPLGDPPLSDADFEAVTKPGKGTYKIANNTLYLTYADGRTVKLGFWILPTDAGKPSPATIYLNEYALTKRGNS